MKRGFAIGAGVGTLVVVWLWLGRPLNDVVSSGGFNISSSPAGTIPFDRRGQTGLAFVRTELTPAEMAARAPAPEAPTPGAAAAPAPEAQPTGDAATLAAQGVRADAAGLTEMGMKDELLRGAERKLLEHPAVLSLLLNNKMLINVFMSRGDVKEHCESSASQKTWLMDTANPNGVSAWLPLAQEALRHPDGASAALNSEFGQRMMNCPSLKQLANDPGSLLQIATANPSVMGLLTDPGTAQALASNTQAAAMLGEAEAGIGGGAMH